MKRRLLGFISSLLILGAFIGVLSQRQLIRDHYVAKVANQQPESVALKERLQFTEYADFIYRASQPEVRSAESFNEACKDVAHEHSIVLGCYARQRIYIYNVQDERLNGVQEVTAAHELLHAVYERLSRTEKAQINRQLTAAAESIENSRFKETVAEYRRTEPGQVENELHSILGTEIEVLPSELEAHYAKYFRDRKRVVNYAKQYEDAFTSLDRQIQSYDQQLESLKTQKENLEDRLASERQAIEAEQKSLETLRAADEREAYNAAVPEYNAKIQAYNNGIAELRQIIEQYNQIVSERNNLAATQNDLVKRLDSSYQPLE